MGSETKKLKVLKTVGIFTAVAAVGTTAILVPVLISKKGKKDNSLDFDGNISINTNYETTTLLDNEGNAYKNEEGQEIKLVTSGGEVLNLAGANSVAVVNPSYSPKKGSSSYYLRAKTVYYGVNNGVMEEINEDYFSVKPEFTTSWLASRDGYYYNVTEGTTSWVEGNNVSKLYINQEADEEDVYLFNENPTYTVAEGVSQEYEIVAVEFKVEAVEVNEGETEEETLARLTEKGWLLKNLLVTNLKLIFDNNGGTGAVTSIVDITEQDVVSVTTDEILDQSQTLVKAGYEFVGWSLDDKNNENSKIESVTFGTSDVVVYAIWKAVDYNLIYNLNYENAQNIIDSNKYHIGNEITLTASPTREGYTFLGWTLDGENLVTKVKFNNSDIEVKAKWDINKYTLTYDYGYNDHKQTIPNKCIGDVVTLETPTRAGYEFLGWQKDGENVEGDTITFGDKDITLTATWNAIDYTLSYNLDGGEGEFEDRIYHIGETFNIPSSVPTKTGYRFTGWTINDKEVENGQTITFADANIVVKANYEVINYSIEYILDNGVATNPTNYNIESNTITLNNPSKEGYTFAGWIGTGIENPTMEVVIPTGSIGERSYTATWNAIDYTLSYNLDGGNFPSQEFVIGDIISSIAFNKNLTDNEVNELIEGSSNINGGFTISPVSGFDGFIMFIKTSSETGITWAPNGTYLILVIYENPEADHETYSDQDAIYRVIYSSETFEENTITTENSRIYMDGVTKAGWQIDSNVFNLPEDYEVNYIHSSASSVNGILLAKNFISCDTTDNNHIGDIVDLPEIEPIRKGYTFLGWMINDSEEVVKGNSFKFGATNTTLTAKWKINDYTLTYNLDGGTGNFEGGIYHFGDTFEIPEEQPTKPGYTFKGWTINGETVNAGQIITFDLNDITVIANFEAIPYTLSYDLNNGGLKFTEIVTGEYIDEIKFDTSLTAEEVDAIIEAIPNSTQVDGLTIIKFNNDVEILVQHVNKIDTDGFDVHYIAKYDPHASEDSQVTYLYFHLEGENTGADIPQLDSYDGWQEGTLVNGVLNIGGFEVFKLSEAEKWNGILIGKNDAENQGFVDENKYTYGEQVSISQNTPTRTGYRFDGWKVNDTNQIVTSEDQITFGAENITLTAQWVKLTKITYIIEEIEGEAVSDVGEYIKYRDDMNGEVEIWTEFPTTHNGDKGYYWTSPAFEGQRFTENIKIPEELYGKEITFTVNWTGKFIVKYGYYDNNNNEYHIYNQETVLDLDAADYTLNTGLIGNEFRITFIEDHKLAYGWKIQGGDGTVYAPGGAYQPTSDVNIEVVYLNAQFLCGENEYGYGSIKEEYVDKLPMVEKVGDQIKLPAMLYNYDTYNYRFTGWLSSEDGQVYKPGQLVDFVDGMTFTAQYKENLVDVKIILNQEGDENLGILQDKNGNTFGNNQYVKDNEVTVDELGNISFTYNQKGQSRLYISMYDNDNYTPYTAQKIINDEIYKIAGFTATSDDGQELVVNIENRGNHFVVMPADYDDENNYDVRITGENITLTAIWAKSTNCEVVFDLPEGIELEITNKNGDVVDKITYNSTSNEDEYNEYLKIQSNYNFRIVNPEEGKQYLITAYDLVSNTIISDGKEGSFMFEEFTNSYLIHAVPGGIKIKITTEDIYEVEIRKGEIPGVEIPGEIQYTTYSHHNCYLLSTYGQVYTHLTIPYIVEGYSVYDVKFFSQETDEEVDLEEFEGNIYAVPYWTMFSFDAGSVEIDGKIVKGEFSGSVRLSYDEGDNSFRIEQAPVSIPGYPKYLFAGFECDGMIYDRQNSIRPVYVISGTTENGSYVKYIEDSDTYYLITKENDVETNRINLTEESILIKYQYNDNSESTTDAYEYSYNDNGEKVVVGYIFSHNNTTKFYRPSDVEYVEEISFDYDNKLESNYEATKLYVDGEEKSTGLWKWTFDDGVLYKKEYNEKGQYYFVPTGEELTSDKEIEWNPYATGESPYLKTFSMLSINGNNYVVVDNWGSVAQIYNMTFEEACETSEDSWQIYESRKIESEYVNIVCSLPVGEYVDVVSMQFNDGKLYEYNGVTYYVPTGETLTNEKVVYGDYNENGNYDIFTLGNQTVYRYNGRYYSSKTVSERVKISSTTSSATITYEILGKTLTAVWIYNDSLEEGEGYSQEDPEYQTELIKVHEAFNNAFIAGFNNDLSNAEYQCDFIGPDYIKYEELVAMGIINDSEICVDYTNFVLNPDMAGELPEDAVIRVLNDETRSIITITVNDYTITQVIKYDADGNPIEYKLIMSDDGGTQTIAFKIRGAVILNEKVELTQKVSNIENDDNYNIDTFNTITTKLDEDLQKELNDQLYGQKLTMAVETNNLAMITMNQEEIVVTVREMFNINSLLTSRDPEKFIVESLIEYDLTETTYKITLIGKDKLTGEEEGGYIFTYKYDTNGRIVKFEGQLIGYRTFTLVVLHQGELPTTHKLVYDVNGGQGEIVDANEYMPGQDATITSEVPTREGYTFLGWEREGVLVEGSTITFENDDITLTAKWQIKDLHVKYEKHEIVMTEIEVGDEISSLIFNTALSNEEVNDIIKNIHQVSGEDGVFYISSENNEWRFFVTTGRDDGFSQMGVPEEALILGIQTTDQQNHTTVVDIIYSTATINEFNENGLHIDAVTSIGWQYDKLKNGVYNIGKNITVKKPYNSESWNGILLGKGSVIITTMPEVYHIGDEITVTDEVPTREGYEFAGWMYNGESVVAGDKITFVDEDIVITAIWNKDLHVKYDMNSNINPVAIEVNDEINQIVFNTSAQIKNIIDSFGEATEWSSLIHMEPVGSGEDCGIGLGKTNSNAPYAVEGTYLIVVMIYDAENKELVSIPIYSSNTFEEFSSNGQRVEAVTTAGWQYDRLENGVFTLPSGYNIRYIPENASTWNGVILGKDGTSTFEIDETIYHIGDTATLTDKVPTRDGYTFNGWSVNGVAVEAGDTLEFTSEKDIIVSANWTAINYTLTYNLNYQGAENVVDPTAHHIYDIVSLSQTPTREGYDFLGWSVDGENIVKEVEFITENIEVFALWQEQSYTLYYNLSGGFGSIQDNNVYKQGQVVTLSDSIPTLNGYNFIGWTIDQENIITSVTFDNNDIMVWAVWEETDLNLTYDLDGGSGTVTDENIYHIGDTVELFSVNQENPEIEKEGYKFNGWLYNGKKEKRVTFAGSNITVVADWVKLAAISIVVENADNEEYNKTTLIYADAGENIELPSPTREGYNLVWTHENGDVFNYNYYHVSYEELGKEFTLTATWKEIVEMYEVKYSFVNPSDVSEKLDVCSSEEVNYEDYVAITKNADILGYLNSVQGKFFIENSPSKPNIATATTGTAASMEFVKDDEVMTSYKIYKIDVSENYSIYMFGYEGYEYINYKYYYVPVDQEFVHDEYAFNRTYDYNDFKFIENINFVIKEGYSISGWKDVSTGTIYNPGESLTLTGNSNFVAQFTPVSFINEYDQGSLQGICVIVNSQENTVLLPSEDNISSRYGYKFVGWRSSYNNELYDANTYAAYDPDGLTTFTVEWEELKQQSLEYNIVFNTNGGSIINQYGAPVSQEDFDYMAEERAYISLYDLKDEKIVEENGEMVKYRILNFEVSASNNMELNVKADDSYIEIRPANNNEKLSSTITIKAIWAKAENIEVTLDFEDIEIINIVTKENFDLYYDSSNREIGDSFYETINLPEFYLKVAESRRGYNPVFAIYDTLGHTVREDIGLNSLSHASFSAAPGGVTIRVEKWEKIYNATIVAGEIEGVEITGEPYKTTYSNHCAPNYEVPFTAEGYSYTHIMYYPITEENPTEENQVNLETYQGDVYGIPYWIPVGFSGGSVEIDNQTVNGVIDGAVRVDITQASGLMKVGLLDKVRAYIPGHPEYYLKGWRYNDRDYIRYIDEYYLDVIISGDETNGVILHYDNYLRDYVVRYVTNGVVENTYSISYGSKEIAHIGYYTLDAQSMYYEKDGETITVCYKINNHSGYAGLYIASQRYDKKLSGDPLETYSEEIDGTEVTYVVVGDNKIYYYEGSFYLVEQGETFDTTNLKDLNMQYVSSTNGGDSLYIELVRNDTTYAYISIDTNQIYTSLEDDLERPALCLDKWDATFSYDMFSQTFTAIWDVYEGEVEEGTIYLDGSEEFEENLQAVQQLYLNAFVPGLNNDLSNAKYNSSFLDLTENNGYETWYDFKDFFDKIPEGMLTSPVNMVLLIRNDLAARPWKMKVTSNQYVIWCDIEGKVMSFTYDLDGSGRLSHITELTTFNGTLDAFEFKVTDMSLDSEKDLSRHIDLTGDVEEITRIITRIDKGIYDTFISEDAIGNGYYVSFHWPAGNIWASSINQETTAYHAVSQLLSEYMDMITDLDITYSTDDKEFRLTATVRTSEETSFTTSRIYKFDDQDRLYKIYFNELTPYPYEELTCVVTRFVEDQV